MKISVCMDALFSDMAIEDGLKRVKDSGIDSIEFWGWWNKDIDQLIKTKDDLDIKIVTFCTKIGSLVDIAKRQEYIEGLIDSIEIAKKLNCTTLITQVGNLIEGVSRKEQYGYLVEGLEACVPILEEKKMNLLIEPLNTLVDHKGYYLSRSDEAFNIVSEVGNEHIKVLYDVYHQQITEGNIISTIERNIDKIGHFHVAGVPGRNELHRGELYYRNIFHAIKNMGYDGYIGLEYFPLEDVIKGIEMVKDMMI